MTRLLYAFLPFVGGAMIAAQAPVNARLRVVLGSQFGSAVVSFVVGLILLLGAMVVTGQGGALAAVGSGPWWAYLGGLFGAVFVVATLVSSPRIGVTVDVRRRHRRPDHPVVADRPLRLVRRDADRPHLGAGGRPGADPDRPAPVAAVLRRARLGHPGVPGRGDDQLVAPGARRLRGEVGDRRPPRPRAPSTPPGGRPSIGLRSVWMIPSATSSATWTPFGRSSRARAWVSARAPNWAAAQGPRPGIARRADPPETWISVPAPRRSRAAPPPRRIAQAAGRKPRHPRVQALGRRRGQRAAAEAVVARHRRGGVDDQVEAPQIPLGPRRGPRPPPRGRRRRRARWPPRGGPRAARSSGLVAAGHGEDPPAGREPVRHDRPADVAGAEHDEDRWAAHAGSLAAVGRDGAGVDSRR